MPTIYDLVTAQEIATYYTSTLSAKIPYLGSTIFPARKQIGLDLSWIKGANQLPVALKAANFDAKAPVRDRIGINKIDTEMPFFRESMLIKEKDRQELNKIMGAANAALMAPIISKIYDDATNLVNGAEVQAERMRMQLLSTGLIAISSEGVDYDYDYKMPSAHMETLLTTAKWSDTTNSVPLDDIRRWQDLVEVNTGNRPARGIMTRKTWYYLLANKQIKLDMNPVGGQNLVLTDSMLKQYLQAKLGIDIAVYNKMYSETVGGAGQLFYPDDTITLIPNGNLGQTFFGTTPEESDLMAGSVAEAQVQIVNTGVAITTLHETDPVNVKTIVSAITLPSFETIDSMFIAKVA